VTIEQVLDLVLAVVTIPGEGDYVAPILEVALDGLRLPNTEKTTTTTVLSAADDALARDP
jgi:hypothetical protein